MELETTKRSLRIPVELCDTFEERAVDTDLVLPDYVPEVAAILKCTMRPAVTSRYQSGDRYTVGGVTCIRVLYLAEDRMQVHCYETTQPFTVSFVTDGALHHHVSVKTDYVNARAVSPRRMDIHGAFRVYLKAVGEGHTIAYTPSNERDVFCRTKTMHTTVPLCETEKMFVIEERIDTGAEIDRLVCSDAVILSTEVKPLVNKLILKGVIGLKTMYTAGEEHRRLTHEIPFSQILDIDGLCDRWICRAKVTVGDYEVRLSSTEGGGISLQFSGKLCAVVQCSELCQEEVVLDVYSVDKPMLCETTNVCFTTLGAEQASRRTFSVAVDLPENITSPIDTWGELKTAVYDEQGLHMCFTVGMIAKDEGGTLGYYERTLDLCEPVIREGDAFAVELLGVEGAMQNGQLRIQADTNITTAEERKETMAIVCNTVTEEQSPYVKSGAAIRIVYADAGESVWDIAKKHHACVQDILAENDLTDATITVPTMLMVPML